MGGFFAFGDVQAIKQRGDGDTMATQHVFTSESVSEGHPDKVCDFIADSVLDACIERLPESRVACEVLCKAGKLVLAGEITTDGDIDYEAIARKAIREIGYTDRSEAFAAETVSVQRWITRQSGDIAMGVDADTGADGEQGAGDPVCGVAVEPGDQEPSE